MFKIRVSNNEALGKALGIVKDLKDNYTHLVNKYFQNNMFIESWEDAEEILESTSLLYYDTKQAYIDVTEILKLLTLTKDEEVKFKICLKEINNIKLDLESKFRYINYFKKELT